MAVDREALEKTARLARLHLDEDQVEPLLAHLTRIVAFVEQLGELDLEDVPPTKHVIDTADVERADEPRPSLDPETALGMAPERSASEFVVPRILPQ